MYIIYFPRCLRPLPSSGAGEQRLRRRKSEAPGVVADRAADVVPHPHYAVAACAAQENIRLEANRFLAARTIDTRRNNRATELARRQRRRLGCDADQYISHDLRSRKARLPEFKQFRVRDAARRAIKWIVQGDMRAIDIDEDGVVPGRNLGAETMVQDRAYAVLAAEPQRLQRVPRLKSHGGKSAP